MFHAVAPGDWGLVAGFNQIFGAAILDRFGVLLNVHPSLLPLYRGPTPSAWCLANGEAVSGFTFHHVTARIDAGPIVHQGVVAIVPSMDTAELDGAISRAAARDLPGVLDAEFLHRGSFKPAQIDARTAYRVHVNYCGVL
jgi:methionyl-tRNA formyltransferase